MWSVCVCVCASECVYVYRVIDIDDEDNDTPVGLGNQMCICVRARKSVSSKRKCDQRLVRWVSMTAQGVRRCVGTDGQSEGKVMEKQNGNDFR